MFYRRKKKRRAPLRSGIAISGQIGTKSMRFAMENTMHVRHSAAERPLWMPEAPKVIKKAVFYRRKKKTRSPLRNRIAFVVRFGTKCMYFSKQTVLHARHSAAKRPFLLPQHQKRTFRTRGATVFFYPRVSYERYVTFRPDVGPREQK